MELYTRTELRQAIDYEVERIKRYYEPGEKLLDEYINDQGIVVAHPNGLFEKIAAVIKYAEDVSELVDKNSV